MAFPDETSGAYIDNRAGDFGLTRVAATYAEVELRVTTMGRVTLPEGTVVCTEDGVRFITTAALSATKEGVYTVHAIAEEAGRASNVEANSITKMNVNLVNVTAITNPAAAYGGADAETDGELLARYREFLRRPISSGNKNHYISWAKEVSGVANAAVVPIWAGPGTVKVIIGGPDQEPLDETVVADCAAHIEEERPIGAEVSIVSVKAKKIDVAATITLADGATVEQVQAELTAELDEWLAGYAFGEEKLLRYSRVLGLLLTCEGVEEYKALALCGGVANVALTDEETPQTGTVTILVG
jgi:uncharacterized phage protein gp47/JayE